MPCTTLLVGKNASYDGSTLMARNEDSGGGHFTSKKFICVMPKDQPRLYKSVISKVEIPLPEDPQRYTAMPNALPDEGIWGEAGVNECNVAMSETETITSNPRVLSCDPMVKTGIGEEDLLTIVLPYIHSAREGVERLGMLLEQYGTYEMNGIGFQDENEIWWLESIGGHHWIAKRVPDDSYVVMPNQQGIDFFDFPDALGAQANHMCSSNLAEFITKNRLDLSMSAVPVAENTHFDVRAALGSHSISDHVYNTPRAWYMGRYFNPKTICWDGELAAYTPESDDIPWSFVPEHKVTVEDVKYVLSSYYQETAYDPYKGAEGGKYRPIGINRNNFVAITQLRPYMPKEIMAVEWIAEGSNAFNAAVPFYANVETTPDYLANTTAEVSTDNFYWVNRLIGALADAHYASCQVRIEHYQEKMQILGYRFILDSDAAYRKGFEDVHAALAEANRQMAETAKKESAELLYDVLLTTSNHMKNAFSRSDH